MAGKLSVAREKLALRILDDFRGKITGDYSDICIGENPENRYFVGKLLPLSEGQTSSFGSDVFIESMGADFYIEENQIATAALKIAPRGDFYYRAYPTLEQQREAFLADVNNTVQTPFADFDALLEAYNENPSQFSKAKSKLIPVYKKVQIHRSDFHVFFKLIDLIDPATGYGVADERHTENETLNRYVDELQEDLVHDEYCYTHEVYERTVVADLLSEDAYKAFLKRNAKDAPPIRQNWNVYVDLRVKKIKTRYLVSVALVNCSQVQSNPTTHKSNKRADDKITIETLFNSGLDIQLQGADFAPIEMDYFADDYKYDSTQKAVGANCSVVYDESTKWTMAGTIPFTTRKP